MTHDCIGKGPPDRPRYELILQHRRGEFHRGADLIVNGFKIRLKGRFARLLATFIRLDQMDFYEPADLRGYRQADEIGRIYASGRYDPHISPGAVLKYKSNVDTTLRAKVPADQRPHSLFEYDPIHGYRLAYEIKLLDLDDRRFAA